jgi:hypothetical protein
MTTARAPRKENIRSYLQQNPGTCCSTAHLHDSGQNETLHRRVKRWLKISVALRDAGRIGNATEFRLRWASKRVTDQSPVAEIV